MTKTVVTDPFTILCLLPEIVLVLVAALVFIGGAFSPRGWMWTAVSVAACLVAGYLLAMQYTNPGLDFSAGGRHAVGPLQIDLLGYAFRWVALVSGALLLLASRQEDGGGERSGALLLITAGTMLVAIAGDLVLLFLALELISIPTYMLLYLGRRDPATSEATAKYFYLSIFSSAVLLYGFSLLYGISGSMSLATIQDSIAQSTQYEQFGPAAFMLPVALIMVLAGLGYKIAAVPFHYYAPDVYQGATALNAGMLAVMPKIAGIAALLRILGTAMPSLSPFAWQAALLLSVLSMTLGNVCALWQNNVRRLMAYSSIAHAGYLLLALTAGLAMAPAGGAGQGVAAAFIYVTVYSIATLGVFTALSYLGSREEELSTIDQLAGLGRSQPMVAAALAVLLFSLAGIPPLAGFWGKFEIFFSALAPLLNLSSPAELTPEIRWLVILAIVGVVNAAVAAAYYLRIIAAMYFRSATYEVKPAGGAGAAWAAVLCATAVLAMGVVPRPLLGIGISVENSLPVPRSQTAVEATIELPATGTAELVSLEASGHTP